MTETIKQPTAKTSPSASASAAIDDALVELEAVADDIRVRLHLANMEAKELWSEKLEPSLFAARGHAKEAKAASKHVVENTLQMFRDFQKAL